MPSYYRLRCYYKTGTASKPVYTPVGKKHLPVVRRLGLLLAGEGVCVKGGGQRRAHHLVQSRGTSGGWRKGLTCSCWCLSAAPPTPPTPRPPGHACHVPGRPAVAPWRQPRPHARPIHAQAQQRRRDPHPHLHAYAQTQTPTCLDPGGGAGPKGQGGSGYFGGRCLRSHLLHPQQRHPCACFSCFAQPRLGGAIGVATPTPLGSAFKYCAPPTHPPWQAKMAGTWCRYTAGSTALTALPEMFPAQIQVGWRRDACSTGLAHVRPPVGAWWVGAQGGMHHGVCDAAPSHPTTTPPQPPTQTCESVTTRCKPKYDSSAREVSTFNCDGATPCTLAARELARARVCVCVWRSLRGRSARTERRGRQRPLCP